MEHIFEKLRNLSLGQEDIVVLLEWLTDKLSTVDGRKYILDWDTIDAREDITATAATFNIQDDASGSYGFFESIALFYINIVSLDKAYVSATVFYYLDGQRVSVAGGDYLSLSLDPYGNCQEWKKLGWEEDEYNEWQEMISL